MTNGFDQSESFQPVANLTKTTLQSGLVLLIPIGLIAWVIVTLILRGLGLPVAWLFGIVLSVAFCVVMNRLRGDKLDKMVVGMALTFDPHGITEKNPLATRFVSWDGLRDARPVKPVVGMSVGKLGRGGRGSRSPAIDALGSAAAVKEPGLVGIGTIEMSTGANAMARETYKQYVGRNVTSQMSSRAPREGPPLSVRGRVDRWCGRRGQAQGVGS